MRYLGIRENDGFAGLPMFEICQEAYHERRKNWKEIVGWAAGDAVVHHADWKAIFDWCAKNHPDKPYHTAYGRGWEVICYLADGRLAFAGGIEAYPNAVRIGN